MYMAFWKVTYKSFVNAATGSNVDGTRRNIAIVHLLSENIKKKKQLKIEIWIGYYIGEKWSNGHEEQDE